MVALAALAPEEYLEEDEVIDVSSPEVRALALQLWNQGSRKRIRFAQLAFEFVRDQIAHCTDVGDPRVTITASETFREGVGLCYAKAHLLAAVLRAHGVPAGLCYQRLRNGDGRHVVHGLVAVYLDDAWHRQDPRGNKPGIDAQFSLARERLAWRVRPALGERDYPEVFLRPHPAVVDALDGASDALALFDGGLPSELPVGFGEPVGDPAAPLAAVLD